MTATDLAPPANTIELVSVDNSKIVGISLYPNRADITRHFKFTAASGLNQVQISGLPNVLEDDTVRVEGLGAATIQDVTVAHTTALAESTTSDALTALLVNQARLNNAMKRSKTSLHYVNTYLDSLVAEHLDVSQLGKVVHEYTTTAENLDDKIIDLEQDLSKIATEIEEEKRRLAGPQDNEKLTRTMSVSLFADAAGELELMIIYAVKLSSWAVAYDIRVNTEVEEKPLTLVYKAIITQSTGEDWTDVPLTLETVNPSFGLGVPKLKQWIVSSHRPVPVTHGYYGGGGPSYGYAGALGSPPPGSGYNSAPDPTPHAQPMKPMAEREAVVTSTGKVNATFRISGLVTIPSDGAAKNFTVAKLDLDATLHWICVPKHDTKVYLNSKIHNNSEYPLLAGHASVYVNGSFISRSIVPAVSPQESFDCSLGPDPSIRVTYHPRKETQSGSGFYNKTYTHVYTQRIRIHNSKSVSVANLKIQDQIPKSREANMSVKLTEPSLPSPRVSGLPPPVTSQPVDSSVTVDDGVYAQWEGADEPDYNLERMGQEGKLEWVCSVPAHGKLDLVLGWEVASSSKARPFDSYLAY